MRVGMSDTIRVISAPFILFRNQGSNNQYRFGIDANGYYFFSDGVTSIIDWTYSPVIIQEGYNRLKVICIGSSIDCYINGFLMITLDDDTHSSGGIALAVTRTQTVAFDNLKVWVWEKNGLWKKVYDNQLTYLVELESQK